MEAATTRPRFRTDLVAECIEAEGQRFIDVIDPDTGDAFRFYPRSSIRSRAPWMASAI